MTSLPICLLILIRHSSLSQVTAIGVCALKMHKELSLSCRCGVKGRVKEERGNGALTRLSVPNPAKPNGVPSVFPAAIQTEQHDNSDADALRSCLTDSEELVLLVVQEERV